MDEIKLHKKNMINSISEMKSLSEVTSNYDVNITFEKSKGDTVDSLVELQTQLKAIRDSLAELCTTTQNALQNTLDTFNKVDNTISDFFDGEEGN